VARLNPTAAECERQVPGNPRGDIGEIYVAVLRSSVQPSASAR